MTCVGQEQFRTLTSGFYRNAEICILVFSLTNRESFESLEDWRDEFICKAEVDKKTYPFVLLGNKVDDDEARDVCQRDIDNFIGLCHNMTYMETSAKTKRNVNEAFSKAVELFLEYQHNCKRKASGGSHESTIDVSDDSPKPPKDDCTC